MKKKTKFLTLLTVSLFAFSLITFAMPFSEVSAGEKPKGQPFEAIWEAISFLQSQIDAIVVTPGLPGPEGPPGESYDDKWTMVEEWTITEWPLVDLEGVSDKHIHIIPIEITADRWYLSYYTTNRYPANVYAMVDIWIYEGDITPAPTMPDALVEEINHGNDRIEEIYMLGPGTYTITLTLYMSGASTDVDFHMELYELTP